VQDDLLSSTINPFIITHTGHSQGFPPTGMLQPSPITARRSLRSAPLMTEAGSRKLLSLFKRIALLVWEDVVFFPKKNGVSAFKTPAIVHFTNGLLSVGIYESLYFAEAPKYSVSPRRRGSATAFVPAFFDNS